MELGDMLNRYEPKLNLTNITHCRLKEPNPIQIYRLGREDVTVFRRLLWRTGQQMKWNISRNNDCSLVSIPYFLKITFSRFPPQHSIHCHNRCLNFCVTRFNTAPLIIPVPSVMRSFCFWMEWGRVAYILYFRYPHRKRSGAVKPGERAGQAAWKHSHKKRHALSCLVGRCTILLKPYISRP
jgi:hypothetical protein